MEYIFILGSHPAWSVAEIAAVLGGQDLFWPKERILLKKNIDFNANSLIKKLGGVLKIAIIEEKLPINTPFVDLAKIASKLIANKASRGEGKLVFGLSDQGVGGQFQAEKIGLQIKKELKKIAISSRLVTSKELELSTVIVGQNKLLNKGAELIFYRDQDNIIIARTLAIQAYKDLSLRDYGRPSRDDHSGMLPPKLAQMMINIARPENSNDLILDPFCGSGTVITEAMLMGYPNLMGTDLSEKAINDSRVNTEWIRDLYQLGTKPKFHLKNASRLDKFLKPATVGAIISEPYLGPQRGLADITLVLNELEDLYRQALSVFYQIMKPGSRAVMVWPVFFGKHYIQLNLDKWRVINPIPKNLENSQKFKISPRDTLLYSRVGQKVWRELIILEK